MENNKDWNSIRNSIGEAVQDIFDGNDIGTQAKEFSDKAGMILKDAGNYVMKSYENTVRNIAVGAGLKKVEEEKPKIFLNARRTESTVRAFFGMMLTAIFGFAFAVVSLVIPPVTHPIIWAISSMPLVAFLSAGLALGVPGMMRLDNLKKAWTYYRIINNKFYINIEDIAKLSNESETTVINNLMKMIKQGIFPEGHFDNSRKCFILSDDMYKEYMALEDQRKEQERIAMQTEPLLTDSGEKTPLERVLEEGRSYIYAIKELHLGIGSEPMSSKLYELENLLAAIFNRVEQEPAELSRMDKLMRYYLPTTLKLIKNYSDFDNIISPDSEVNNTKKEIELTIDAINQAFKEFQNRMFKDSAFDASTDAALLKVMLAKEGLVGGMEETQKQ